ncbi:MAG TPA: response regulator, partial [Ramlibacter sp.]|nr:response regulator [Ramlibacter sp.]
AGFRMLEMVNLSLGLFRMETGTYEFSPQAVDLRELVKRVLVDLHSAADATAVSLHLRGSDTTPVRVRAEELLCYSIVANLVKNAIEATPRGGQVMLELREGDPVVLTIHNTAEVPPDIAARFFEKYVTRGKTGGTGLGTYSARLMARAQQGDLHMRTNAKDGTTLILTLRPLSDSLPVPLADEAPRTPAAEAVAGMPARNVLLVDDDEYLRLVVRRFLPSPPFNVETAPNGLVATEIMETRWPDFLLCDMEMPLKDGLETVRWVRATEAAQGKPRCRIVMMSGNDEPATASLTRAAGADRFLPKPVSREALLAAVRSLEAGEAAPVLSTAIVGSTPVWDEKPSWQETEPPAPSAPAATAASAPAPAPAPAAGTPAEASEFTSTPDDELVTIDPEWMDVFPGFVRTQRETVEAIAVALAEGKREDVKFLAHRAAGGLATMGLHWAAQHSRFLERRALDGSAEDLQLRITALREHLARVRIQPAS